MKQRAFRWLAAAALLLWCGVFLRAENTEKSMVRALLIQPPQAEEAEWTVGLLYQFPEAEADSSEARAAVRFCSGQGKTPEEARQNAESGLPRQASYRICEYLAFSTDCSLQAIRQLAVSLQKDPVQGVSKRVLLYRLPEEFSSLEEETGELPEQLLQALKNASAQMPRLYASARAMLLPVMEFPEGGAAFAGEGALLTETGTTCLPEDETRMARLLLGRGTGIAFPLEEGIVTFRRCVVSVEAEGGGFRVTLSGQSPAGAAPVTPEQRRQLEELCVRTLRHSWENGADLLSLGAVRALRQGGKEALTTKNACPQLRADVKF